MYVQYCIYRVCLYVCTVLPGAHMYINIMSVPIMSVCTVLPCVHQCMYHVCLSVCTLASSKLIPLSLAMASTCGTVTV